MPTLYTQIEINAPRSAVWQTLFRKNQWAYWNTYLYDCDPDVAFAEGQETLLALRRVPGDVEMEFQPRVTLVQPNVCLVWVSAIPGFACEQVFELQDIGRDRTRYSHQERFSGALTRFFLPFIRKDEQQGIQRMAWELKQFVEPTMRQHL